MINFTEVERIVDTYIKKAKGNQKKLISIEFGTSLIEKAYALYYTDKVLYKEDILEILDNNADLIEMISDYESIILFHIKFDSIFLEILKSIKNKPLPLLFFEYQIGIGSQINPLLYKISAFVDLFKLFTVLNMQDITLFAKFMDIPFYEFLLAKMGQPETLLELIREELISNEDILTYSKWAEIDLKSIKSEITIGAVLIINNIDSDLPISNIKIENDDFLTNKNEIIASFGKSLYRKSIQSVDYFNYLVINKIDKEILDDKVSAIFFESIDFESLDLISFLAKNYKEQLLSIDKSKIYNKIIQNNTIESMHLLIELQIIQIDALCDFYLGVVLNNFQQIITKNYDFIILREIHSHYKSISLYNHPKILELVAVLKSYGSKEYNTILLELQEILFFNFYMNPDEESFSTLFPDLYQDLLFIEKYNMLNTYADFNSYMKNLGIKPNAQRSFLRDHLYVIINKLDSITLIISQQLVGWKSIQDTNIARREKIVTNMISSIHDINQKILIIIEFLNDKEIDIEKLFEDQGKNKIETLSFIKNSGFGELKINGLFNFDGTNQELSNIIALVNKQLAILQRPKEIDHFNIISGVPATVQLFETKNLEKVLTFDEEFNISKIITQQQYLLELTKSYKNDINFEMFLFINNGFSVFVKNFLMQFEFKNISGICYDFSIQGSDFGITRFVKTWGRDYSSKDVSLMFKTEPFKKLMNHICLKSLDSTRPSQLANQLCSQIITLLQPVITDKSHRNAISTVLNDTVQSKLNKILQKFNSMV